MPKRRLRILHVNPERGWGGGEQQVLGLIDYLAAQDHACCLACDPSGLLKRRASERGITTVDMTIRNDLALGAAWMLRRMLGKLDWDIVHLHTRKAQSLSLYLPRRRTFRVVATRRMDYEVKRDWFHRKLYGCVDGVLAVSEAVKEVLTYAGVDSGKIWVVHSGVDPARFANSDRAFVETVRRRACVGDATRLIGIAGVLEQRKAHDVLLRAVRILRQDGEDVACVAAGEGPLRQPLLDLSNHLGIADRVHLLGFVDDMASFYRSLDVFVLPSNKEAMGNSLMEAMASEVPVVASRVGGSVEIVEEAVSGMLFPPGDSRALARAISTLLRDPGLGGRMARAGRERILASFTIERMAAANEHFYYQLFQYLNQNQCLLLEIHQDLI